MKETIIELLESQGYDLVRNTYKGRKLVEIGERRDLLNTLKDEDGYLLGDTYAYCFEFRYGDENGKPLPDSPLFIDLIPKME